MSVDPTVLTAAVLLPLAVAVYGVFIQVPRAMVSADRYRLWALRDRVVGDIIDGTIKPSPAAAQLVHDIEGRIQSARRFTIGRIAMIAVTVRGMTFPEELRDKPAPHADAERIGAYRHELFMLTNRALRTNSLPGLALGLVFSILRPLRPLRSARVERFKSGIRQADRAAVREPKLIGISAGPIASLA